MTEYFSTNGRTFERPPENWDISNWQSRELWFHGSPQTLTADYILEGATGASGHVYEPLAMTPRPDLLLLAYYRGPNLARELLSGHPAAELAEHRGGRSTVFAGEAVRLASRKGAKAQRPVCGFDGLCLRHGCLAHA